MNNRKGKCLCGSINFEITSEPLGSRICWCNDCQHISANGTVSMLVHNENLNISGKLSEFKKDADSGNEVIRQFCSNCGVHLFAKSSGRPEVTIVRVGNLDEPSSVAPTTNIWVASAPIWACLDLELERIEHQPILPNLDTHKY